MNTTERSKKTPILPFGTDKLKAYFYLTVIMTLIVTVIRTVSILTLFESDIGYYVNGAFLPKLQVILMILSAAMMISVFFIKKKGELPKERPVGAQLPTFAAFLCGTVHISSGALLVMYQRTGLNLPTVIILVGFAAAAVHFFYDSLCPAEKKSPYSVLLSIVAVVGLIAVVAKAHLDYTVTLNNPNKNMLFLTLGAICLFIVQEMRYTVGIPQPRMYVCISSIAMMLSFAHSIPGIIGHYANKLSGGDFLIYYIITFAYGVYIFTRLFTFIKFAEYKDGDEDDDTTAESLGDTE